MVVIDCEEVESLLNRSVSTALSLIRRKSSPALEIVLSRSGVCKLVDALQPSPVTVAAYYV